MSLVSDGLPSDDLDWGRQSRPVEIPRCGKCEEFTRERLSKLTRGNSQNPKSAYQIRLEAMEIKEHQVAFEEWF
jgi:hypothetical protein